MPVYNLEMYLRQCVDSILGQTFRDLELILIDDGSNDSSSAICGGYAENDSRVKVIRKENAGVSSARNAGLDAASGEYVLFIDGDDYIEKDSLMKIMEAAGRDGARDVAFLKAVYVLSDGREIPSYDTYDKRDYYNKSHSEVLKYLAGHYPLPVSVWGKLIRRAVLKDNGIYFTEGIICEDVDFCLKLYMHAKTYNYIDVLYYYYRKDRAGSVMSINKGRKFYDLLFIISKWAGLAKTAYKEYAAGLDTILAFQYCVLLTMYRGLSKRARTAQKQKTAEYAWLLGVSADLRVRLVGAVYKLSGITGASFLLRCYNRLKSLAGGDTI